MPLLAHCILMRVEATPLHADMVAVQLGPGWEVMDLSILMSLFEADVDRTIAIGQIGGYPIHPSIFYTTDYWFPRKHALLLKPVQLP